MLKAEIKDTKQVDYNKKFSPYTTKEIVANSANIIARNIPQKIDYLTTLTSVLAWENTLIIWKELNTDHKDFIDIWSEPHDELISEVFKQDSKIICQNKEYYYLITKRDMKLRYRFFDKSSKELFDYTITKEDCEKIIPPKKEKTVYDRIQNDKKWLHGLDTKEQKIALLFSYENFNKHMVEVLMPEVRNGKDILWTLKVNYFALQFLKNNSTKQPKLSAFFSNYRELLGSRIRGKINQQTYLNDSNKYVQELINFKQQVSKKDLLTFIQKHEKHLTSFANSLIVYAKYAEYATSTDNNKSKQGL